ncbi:Hypothetical predicted protein [Octopus vulgaris]|uniref:Uncharacterized protein n=1 Tax=Octopus vulgaris TaxID=6645 RepID=A0AA36BBQ5_OCTVU|nr:Hypothetical predicted protein [Octopus vulgaris]
MNTNGEVTGENRTLDCLNGYYYTTPVDKSIVSQAFLLSSATLVCELYPKEKRIIMTGIFLNIWSVDTSTQQTASPVNETNLDGRNCESNVEANVKAVVDQSQIEVEKEAPMLVKLLVIFKSPYLRKVTIVMSIAWAVDMTSANGIMLMSEVLGDNVYIVFPSICSLEILTNSLYAVSAKRSAGSGFATTFVRTVGLSTPLFKLLALNIPWAPGIIIGTGCIVSSILLHIYLPETGNLVLPQKINDVI